MCKLKISHVRYINHMYPIGLSKPMLPCVMGRRGFAAPPHRVDFCGDGQIWYYSWGRAGYGIA